MAEEQKDLIDFNVTTETMEYARQISGIAHNDHDGLYIAVELLREFAAKVRRRSREELAEELARYVRDR